MEEATHLACFLVAGEAVIHTFYHNGKASVYDFHLGLLFLASYLLCIAAIVLNLKDIKFFQSARLRDIITLLHGLDGFNAVLIGVGLYNNSILITFIGLLFMTKLFLLYLLSRMVTGVKTHSNMEVILQTTKTFIHHTGSFYFIQSSAYEVIVITSLWRFISMNGHAAMTLRKKLSSATYNRVMWGIAHCRNAVVVLVLLLCVGYPSIRRGFAYSACGHVAYMLVRMGPVFRIGSLYFPEEAAAARWAHISDTQRLTELFSLKHPFFALELGILLVACVYFMTLRVQLMMFGTV